jgi:hypothetical protein
MISVQQSFIRLADTYKTVTGMYRLAAFSLSNLDDVVTIEVCRN